MHIFVSKLLSVNNLHALLFLEVRGGMAAEGIATGSRQQKLNTFFFLRSMYSLKERFFC